MVRQENKIEKYPMRWASDWTGSVEGPKRIFNCLPT
jgi:hypothetical protein